MNEETGLLDEDQRHQQQQKGCGSLQKICYGLGHVHNDLCAAVWFSYTLFYLEIVIRMDAATAGALIMIGQVADSLATPAAGWAVDWTGAPRAWHLTGSVLVAAGFSLLFSYNPGSDRWWAIAYYTCVIIGFQVGWAMAQIAHLAIITKISTSDEHSSDLTAIRYIASVCCNIFVYVLTWAILKSSDPIDGIGAADYDKFKEVVLIITGAGVFCSALFYCGITDGSAKSAATAEEPPARAPPGGFLRSPVTYQVSLMYMSSRLYTILNLIYIPLWLNERMSKFTDNGNGSGETLRSAIATVPLVCFLASFLTSVILKNSTFASKEKCTYAFGAVASLVGCLWIAIGAADQGTVQVYCIAALIGVSGSATVVPSLCLTARFVNSNGFGGGSVYSTVTFTDKLMSGFAVLIIQHFKCADSCPNFYGEVLAYGVAVVTLIGAVSLLTLHFGGSLH